jgi:hypothetical protein
MIKSVSRHHLLALVLAAGLFAPGIGCKTARSTATTACPPLANNCCAPVNNCCQQQNQPQGCCQLGARLLDKHVAGKCDCAPHNPLDPYNRCGVPTTVPTPTHVIKPQPMTSIPVGPAPTTLPQVVTPTTPPVGAPLPPTSPEPFKPMGVPLPEILKDKPMEIRGN